ncbi:MAG: nitrate ABC transporter permease [Acidimicrobiales bacterium]
MNERLATRSPEPEAPADDGPILVLGHVRGAGAPPPGPASSPPGAPPNLTMGGQVRRTAASIGWALVGFGALIALWAFGATRVPQLPSPSDTFAKLQDLLSEPFYDRGPNDKGVGLRMYASLERVFLGFGLAMVVGIPLGFAIGASKRAWQAFNPLIQVLRPVSPLAWFPIWLVIFKDAGRAALWVIFITSLWPTVLNTAAGAAAVPSDQRAVARVFRFGKLAYLRHVLVPNTLPAIVTGMRVSMGIAWMVIVAVEMLASGGGTGIGSYVWEQYNALNLAAMVAAIVLIGITGYLLDLIFMRLGRAVAIEEPVA